MEPSSRERLFALLCCLDGAPDITLGLLQRHVPDSLELTSEQRLNQWLDDLIALEAEGSVELTADGINVLGDPERGLTDPRLAADAYVTGLEVFASLLPVESWLPSAWSTYKAYGQAALRLISRCQRDRRTAPVATEIALRWTAYLHSSCQYAAAEPAMLAAVSWAGSDTEINPGSPRAQEGLVRAWSHIGRILDALGVHDSAVKAHHSAVSLARTVYLQRPARLAGVLLYYARSLRDLGEFERALEQITEAIDLLDAAAPAGTTAPDALGDVRRLQLSHARLLIDLGQVQQGIERLRGLLQQDVEGQHRWIGDAALPYDQSRELVARGQMERELGTYADAAQFLQRACHLNRLHFGNEHIVVAKTYDELARVHRDQGEFQSARDEYAVSLSIKSLHLDQAHPEIARTRVALAGAERRLGNHAEAADQAELGYRSLTAHGKARPDAVQAVLTRSAIARDMGQFDESVQGLVEAERRIAELPQPLAELSHLSHPLAAVLYTTRSSIERANGTLATALQYAEWATTIDLAHYGREHAETARPLVERGRVLRRVGEFERSRQDLQAAEEILRWSFRGIHPELARLAGYRARMFRSSNGVDAARDALLELRRALALTRSMPGSSQLDAAALTAEYGRAVLAEGRLDEAVTHFESALSVQDHAGPGSVPTFEASITWASLGDVYARLGAEWDCRRAKERALEIKKDIFGPHHNQVVRTLRDYAAALDLMFGDRSSDTRRQEVLGYLEEALGIAEECDVQGLDALLPTAQALGTIVVRYASVGTRSEQHLASLRSRVVEDLRDGLGRVERAFEEAPLSAQNPHVTSSSRLLERLSETGS